MAWLLPCLPGGTSSRSSRTHNSQRCMDMASQSMTAPSVNKGRRYTIAERDQKALHGHVHSGPPLTLRQDVQRVLKALESAPGDDKKLQLVRYEALMHVLESDETLFFATAQSNLRRILPMIYTPAVGTACLNYSQLNIKPRGLWIGVDRKGSIDKILEAIRPDLQVIVVTDGERILGLGDLGANGHGIPVGKLLLYSACGGIDPTRCLPVTLDVGCNIDKVRDDDYYIGLRQERVTGREYDDFVDEFMRSAKKRFGERCLIQFEDFANPNALPLLNKYKDDYCMFNDDIQGTAAVGLAGMLSALRLDGVPSDLKDHRFLFFGAGSAGLGIADLVVRELMRQGLDENAARQRCYFMDSRGLIYEGREKLTPEKEKYAHAVDDNVKAKAKVTGKMEAKDTIPAMVRLLRPTGLIGVSTIFGAFSNESLAEMSEVQRRPIIFALSNPNDKAECTAEAAYKASNGRAVFASGSPFDPVTIDGKTLVPGQGNNAYCFPGIGLGTVAAKATRVTDTMILAAARKLASLVSPEQLDVSNMYPPLDELLDISAEIAHHVAEQAVEDGVATTVPKVEEIREMMYTPGRSIE